MNARELITEHLDIWTTAQEPKKTGGRGRGKKANGQDLYGIKKLRELILDLAVRGKLVEQNPEDEPASVLLEKIAEEKARLLKEGKIKKQKKLPEITEEEKPFALPDGWEWVKLTELYYSISPARKKIKSSQILEAGKFPVVDQGKSHIAGYINDANLLIEIPGPVIVFGDHTREKKYVDFDFVAGADGTKIIRPYRMSEKYFYTYLMSYKLESRGYARHFKVLNVNLMALPPLAEQHRIVAKVDELMAICGQLEQQQTTSNTTHQTLLQTLLATLTTGGDHEAFTTAWERIATHFDILFTTEQSIDQLKQTILQLAVMGKLVPQNPEDEPAATLLKKIAKEKTRLLKEGKIKKQKKLPEITEEEKPFALPAGWEWARLQEAIDVRDGTHDSPKDAAGSDTYPLVTSKNFQNGKINFDEARRISAEDYFNISKRSFVERYDILFSMIGGNLGNQVMVDDDRPFSVKNVALFKYYDRKLTLPFFIKKFMEHLALDLQSKAAGGAQPFVSLGFLRKLVGALPPLAEQHRIVAKVDELMSLCDQLKSRLHDSQTTKLHLADTIVKQAVA